METQTQEKVQEGELVEIILGESFDLSKIKPNNSIVVADGRRELVNRIIPLCDKSHLVVTISKTKNGSIAERTYYAAPEVLTYNGSINEIPAGHERYNELSKLIDENLEE